MAAANDPIDFALDSDGDLAFPMSLTRGIAAVAQGINEAVQLFRGEWFLDLERGIPYYQDILGQKFDRERVLFGFRAEIVKVPDVKKIESLTATYSGTTRIVTIAFEVLSIYGPVTGIVEV